MLEPGGPVLGAAYHPERRATAAGFGDALLQAVPRWPAIGRGRRVIVLGAGVAGLCAAWSLREAGFEPLVLERCPRPGGRILTCRESFAGQYVELGVTRIPESHPLALAYIRRFGLPLVPYPTEGAGQLYALQQARFKSFLGAPCRYPEELRLSPSERAMDAESLHHLYTTRLLTSIERDGGDEAARAERRVLCGLSFYESLRRLGASAAAQELCRAYDGSEILRFGALGWLANMQRATAGERAFAIAGGNDQLTAAFAAALGDRVVTGAHVHEVRHRERWLSVSYTRGGYGEQVEGAFVVCAVPHRVLLELRFDPPLADDKLQAARAVPMFAVTRLNFQFARRFWNLDEGLRGLLIACTMSPLERLWDLSVLQAGERGILSAYLQDRNAERMDALPSDEERIKEGLSQLEALFPAARGHFLRGSVFSWQKPWTHGGWAVFGPGQLEHLAALQHSEGPIFFAGDHTSSLVGWVQGALESAHCAVAELLTAAR